MADSWYAVVRKRLAPLALILAVGLLAHDTCSRQAHQPVTLRFDLGAQAARVVSLQVEVLSGGDVIGQLRRGRQAAALGAPELKLSLPEGEAELRIELEVAPVVVAAAPAGEPVHKQLTRRVHAEGGATVTIALASDVAGP